MKQLIIILLFFCSITGTSVCGNYHGSPHFDFISSNPKNENKPNYSISASNEAILISSVAQGSQIWVFNASGQNIYNKVAKESFVAVPIRSKGIFIIRIKSSKEIYTTKVIVK
ncbi:putative secreted protein (Por secretion system target) [Dysgonomonas alginatilytica]|uniref:Putative secreted protein (Por secretion system target) n=1 Tax=Dysgonomonas alginatilytica TaxID=1605892 RepID=A0A2V3PXC1_9BACT|nr:T9SS type A sorting domain-containing protein [Dysgonomonas alginatilytica]PXV69248.1 putative secreted protein (Por secretion system target) [Dysgonomonas alginatilytica]